MATHTHPNFFIPNTKTFPQVVALGAHQPTLWILFFLFCAHVTAWTVIPHWITAPSRWGWAILPIFILKFFLEWFIHGNVQHPAKGVLKWLRHVMPRGPARSHGRHHADPSKLDELLFPIKTMPAALLAAWVVFGPLWLLSPRVALAAIAYAIGKAWWLDLVHFVIHTEWQPRGPFGWLIGAIRPRHALHHGYGRIFGLTKAGNAAMRLEITSYWGLADRLFGTTDKTPWWKDDEWWSSWSHFTRPY